MQTQNSPAANLPDDYIFQLAAASSQDGPLYFAARASGLFRSYDAGQTWDSAYAALTTSERLPTLSVAIAPNFEREPVAFAGLNGALLRSHDGGRAWQRCRLPAPPPAISALAISPGYAGDGTVFAGTSEDGVLVSSDRGQNWAAWNFGLLDLNILCLGISPDFAADETIFAGTESGLFRSTNGGRAWKEISLPTGFDAILSLALSTNFAQDGILFAGTENNGLLISRDRGKSWGSLSETTSSAPVNQILLSASGAADEIVILHGGALLLSNDGGQTWAPWHAEQLGDWNITSVLALNEPDGNFLMGLEGGRILRV